MEHYPAKLERIADLFHALEGMNFHSSSGSLASTIPYLILRDYLGADMQKIIPSRHVERYIPGNTGTDHHKHQPFEKPDLDESEEY